MDLKESIEGHGRCASLKLINTFETFFYLPHPKSGLVWSIQCIEDLRPSVVVAFDAMAHREIQ
jgi:hypothetical protein